MIDEPNPPGSGGDWEVIRTDDNGQSFAVRSGLTEDEARRLHDELTRRGHKQLYEFRRRPQKPSAGSAPRFRPSDYSSDFRVIRS